MFAVPSAPASPLVQINNDIIIPPCKTGRPMHLVAPLWYLNLTDLCFPPASQAYEHVNVGNITIGTPNRVVIRGSRFYRCMAGFLRIWCWFIHTHALKQSLTIPPHDPVQQNQPYQVGTCHQGIVNICKQPDSLKAGIRIRKVHHTRTHNLSEEGDGGFLKSRIPRNRQVRFVGDPNFGLSHQCKRCVMRFT